MMKVAQTTTVHELDPRRLVDADLLEYSLAFGRLTLKARNKFIGALPEVARRGVYFKKGFESIFHFAKMTGGVSEEQVKTVLNLAQQFSRLPHLILLLLTGKVSINKLIRVASVAHLENEEFWANQVQLLSNRALETLVRDQRNLEKNLESEKLPAQTNLETTSLFEAVNSSIPLHVQKVMQSKNDDVKSSNVPQYTELQLDTGVHDELLELQNKGININAELREFLRLRKENLEAKKSKQAQVADERALRGEGSRAVRADTERLLDKEYGAKCAQPGCTKKSQEIHHTNRYALTKSHNPYYLAPLCKEHHAIAHSIDVKVTEQRRI